MKLLPALKAAGVKLLRGMSTQNQSDAKLNGLPKNDWGGK